MQKILLMGFSLLTILFVAVTLWKRPTTEMVSAKTVIIKTDNDRHEDVPQPEISPQEVVNIQLEALQVNDLPYENHGIEIAFRFASPSNKESTGSLPQFIHMVQNETYQSLLNFKRFGLDDPEIRGDKALQKVTLIDENDQPVVYFFKLSKQKEGTYTGCWLTDGVVRF